MSISQLRNPYDFRNPVRDAAVFAGRGEEKAAIWYELAQAGLGRPSVCVVLHGPRAAGKTSLLNAADRMARERDFVSVRVELIEGDGEPTVFFRKVYDELATAVAEAVMARGEVVPFDMATVRRIMAGATAAGPGDVLQFPEAVILAEASGGRVPEAALRADLTYIVRLLGRPVALLVDEAQLIADDARVLSILRFLTSRVDGLVLVLAGTSGLIDQIREVHSQILRQFKEIEVKQFVEHQDVQDCIVRPLRAIGLHAAIVPHSVVRELMHLTDGNPYEIQLYCHEMFARYQRGEAEVMKLTPDVLESIRSQLESVRNLMERPLIGAVRAMNSMELTAFSILTSALGRITVDQAWFSYIVAGVPAISRADYDRCHGDLVARGILLPDDIISFAVDAELLDEIYARLWTASKLNLTSHAQLTGRGRPRELLVYRLLGLLHEFSGSSNLRTFPTCCAVMGVKKFDGMISALEILPEAGPDETPAVSLMHAAILQAGEPRALDVTRVVCRFGELSVERWMFAPDTDDIVLSNCPEFIRAAARIAQAGGELTASRVRIPLKTWPADEWFDLATGRQRSDLADNYLEAAYRAYSAGEREAALRYFQLAFDLVPAWEQANNVTYVALASGLSDLALRWSSTALKLTSDPVHHALSMYNAAVAHLMGGNTAEAAMKLELAARELASLEVTEQKMGFLMLPGADDPATLHEETNVDLNSAVRRVQVALGLKAEDGPIEQAGAGRGGPVASKGEMAAIAAGRIRRSPIVLAVATEWTSSHGGLSTFNRELCRALAAAGADMYCIVLAATAQELASAEAAGVKLLPAPATAGGSDDMRLASRPKLPKGSAPDLIIGHSRITGAVAQRLADDLFPNARRLHFVHMSPDEIEWLKPGREIDAGLRATERTGIERELGASAHRVFAVGPRLHDQFLAEFVSAPRPPLRIDPGFDESDAGGPRNPPGGSPLRVLLLGRAEDSELKGIALAAAACGRADEWLRADGQPRLRLVVRGAPPGTGEYQRDQITNLSGSPELQVVVREYSAEVGEIRNDLDTASLVLMPSRSEGFGLVGAEAISRGVPVLISAESGLGQLLHEELDQRNAGRFVVPVTGDLKRDTDVWARAIDRLLRERESAFSRVAALRETLAQKVTWAAAAAAVLGEAEEICEG